MLAAPVAELLGIRAWYLAGGMVCLLMGVSAFFVPAIVHIESDARREDTTAVEGLSEPTRP